jgi:hypothetical protein
MPKHYTQAQAALALGVSQPRIVYLLDKGRLGTRHEDGTYTITKQDINRYRANRKPGRPSLARPEKG